MSETDKLDYAQCLALACGQSLAARAEIRPAHEVNALDTTLGDYLFLAMCHRVSNGLLAGFAGFFSHSIERRFRSEARYGL